MKNRQILMGILAIVLVFGLIVIGCDNGTTDEESNPFVGVWIENDTRGKLEVSETGWVALDKDNVNLQKGTYLRNGNTATAAFSQTHWWNDEGDPAQWDEDTSGTVSCVVSDDGKTLLWGEDYTYTKQN
jgi:hypothetical protein